MKNVKIAIAAIALSTLSFGSFAAELVNHIPDDQVRVGVVSASESSDLSSLTAQLKTKADAAGAKSFRITSTSGQNKLHGTAVIYQ